jgi:HPt (histidine-containing phosphotransfer) domain-containing protein
MRAARLIRCPSCNHMFVVKASGEAEAVAPEAEAVAGEAEAVASEAEAVAPEAEAESLAGIHVGAEAAHAVEKIVIPPPMTREQRAEAASPTPSGPAGPVPSVDMAALRRLASAGDGDRSEIVARVVNTYRVTSQKLLVAIVDAVDAEDVRAFVSAAHTLKSSSAHLGALKLSSLCKDLEGLGRGDSCEGAGELVNVISEEFASVQAQLAAENFAAQAPTDSVNPESPASPPHP